MEVDIEGRTLSLSNLDKVLYPEAGFTKGQVIDYYSRVAPAVLPHLRSRPLTLKRYPNGVDKGHFYEKQCPSHRPDWVQTTAVHSRHRGGIIDFCLAEDLPTLVWLSNLADLELHTSLARAEDVTQPTILAFDLDPGPPATIVECAGVALALREALDHLGMQAWPKTSGSKGMQVYVPINVPVTYEDTKPFALGIAKVLERRLPDLVISEMRRDLRKGKVFVDWSQNDEHKTTVSVYSLRALPQPTVSTPLTWEEVEAVTRSEDPGRAGVRAAGRARPPRRARRPVRPRPGARAAAADPAARGMSVDGRVAVVTGAASGIGRATAELLAERGARVVVAGLQPDGLEETVAAITGRGGEAIAVETDIADAAAIEALAARTAEAFGGADILVNNAAIYPIGPWHELAPERLDDIFAVNVRGYWLCSRALRPQMLERGGGAIVNVASVTFFTGEAAARRLRRLQGRGDRLHPRPRARGRPGEHPRQRGRARRLPDGGDGDPHRPGEAVERRARRPVAQAARRDRRRRPGDRLLRVRRRGLRHGPDAARGRRLDAELSRAL